MAFLIHLYETEPPTLFLCFLLLCVLSGVWLFVTPMNPNFVAL